MDYSVIDFDTAPAGQTQRLLQLPSTLEKGLAKLMTLKNKFGGLLSQVLLLFLSPFCFVVWNVKKFNHVFSIRPFFEKSNLIFQIKVFNKDGLVWPVLTVQFYCHFFHVIVIVIQMLLYSIACINNWHLKWDGVLFTHKWGVYPFSPTIRKFFLSFHFLFSFLLWCTIVLCQYVLELILWNYSSGLSMDQTWISLFYALIPHLIQHDIDQIL